MKLGEALKNRKDIMTSLGELRRRIALNISVVEGKEPAEDPKSIVATIYAKQEELYKLIVSINRTNAATTIESPAGPITISEAIARRDYLVSLRNTALDIAREASNSSSSNYETIVINNETKYANVVKLLSFKDFQDQADQLAKQIRELDNTLQAANWTVDLLAE